jgi:hypothetical protein
VCLTFQFAHRLKKKIGDKKMQELLERADENNDQQLSAEEASKLLSAINQVFSLFGEVMADLSFFLA